MTDRGSILLDKIIRFNKHLEHPETGVLRFIEEKTSLVGKDYGLCVDFQIVRLENTDQILKFFLFKGNQMVNKFQLNIPMIISGCILEYGDKCGSEVICQKIVDEFKSYIERIYGKPDRQDNDKITSVFVLKCPSCGAPIQKGQKKCDYCLSNIIFTCGS